jgi:hypothetical protein
LQGWHTYKNIERTHDGLVGDEDPVAYYITRGHLGSNVDTSTFNLYPFASETTTCDALDVTFTS